MSKRSAGLLPYRYTNGELEVLLVHPGGPFWAKKDVGAWSIAKGEYDETESAFDAALREFREETGTTAPRGRYIELTPIRLRSGKLVSAWAVEMDWNPDALVSNLFELELPKGSGRIKQYPEVDRAAWFAIAEARRRIIEGQRGFIDELAQKLD